MKARPKSEDGVTLIETMVAILVIGILAGIILEITRQTTQAVQQNQALSRMFNDLHSAGERLSDDLRTFSRKFDVSSFRFRFVGRNGDDGFEATETTSARPSSASAQDHLHIHAMYSSSGDTDAERIRLCYFLNDGEHPYLEDQDGDGTREWGLLKRRDRFVDQAADPDSLVPPLNIDITDLTSARPIGYGIDRFSMRYYDSDSDKWYNAWDSEDEDRAQIDARGEFPDAIEFAIRRYDPGNRIDPRWYVTVVSLEGG